MQVLSHTKSLAAENYWPLFLSLHAPPIFRAIYLTLEWGFPRLENLKLLSACPESRAQDWLVSPFKLLLR